jgi:ribose 5-phosphate isomerase A
VRFKPLFTFVTFIMTQDELKLAAAKKALDYVVPGSVIGIGSGSTVNIFIAELGKVKHLVKAAVSSSEKSSQLLRDQGIEVLDLNDVEGYPVYFDGADEINYQLQMIKGGGAALTREKIVSAVAEKFVCMVDESKVKSVLGAFALPVEVIPMARAQVSRELAMLGGTPKWRQGVVTDNGNILLDVAGFHVTDAVILETHINQITGVVCNGLFARRPASVALIARPNGVEVLNRR